MSVDKIVEYDDGKVYDDEGRTYFPTGLTERLDLSEGDIVRYIYRDDRVEVRKVEE